MQDGSCANVALPSNLLKTAEQRCPAIRHRVGLVSASTHFGEAFRPDLFDRTVSDLPAMGFNGVLMVVSTKHGSSIGRELLPFRFDENGAAVPIEDRAEVWREHLDVIKARNLEVYLTLAPVVPPGFTFGQVKQHYSGKAPIKDFPMATRRACESLASAIFVHLPQVDGLMLHSLECEDVWGDAASPFPAHDVDVAAEALGAYLDGLDAACRLHGKAAWFWTHVWGVDAHQLRVIRAVLGKREGIVPVEDHYWPNAGWPNLPFMGFLPEELLDTMRKPRRFGVCLDTTDGEYYGGGSLPTAYPEPHWHAALSAVERGAEVAIVRFNEQDRTSLGTLYGMNGIMITAVAEALWQPAPDLDSVWKHWTENRFGVRAARHVENALHQCGVIITEGFCYRGMNLVDHSSILPYLWDPNSGGSRAQLFAPDRRLLHPLKYDDVDLGSWPQWQTRVVSGTLLEYLESRARATRAAEYAKEEIESARQHLSEEDYLHLHGAFAASLDVLRALGILAELADSCLNKKPASVPVLILQLRALADELDSRYGTGWLATQPFIEVKLRGRSIAAPSVPDCLRVIAESYDG